MKRFLTLAAATAVIGATPALAQYEGDWADLIRTRDITGGPVYTSNEIYDDNSWGSSSEMGGDTSAGLNDGPAERATPQGYRWGWSGYESVDQQWQQIGEIEDVVLDRSGQMTGIVAEVGGFLDIGDKHVLLQVEDVDLIPIDDGQYAFLTRYSEEELEQMEGVDEGWWE